MLLLFLIAYYGATLTRLKFNPFGGVSLGLTFNSMLDHLLHGQFDVDPDIVGLEGYAHDGRVYAYWGVFPAILRLPLVLIPGGLARLDVTVLSCWVAVCTAGMAKVRTVLALYGRAAASRRKDVVTAAVLAYLVLGGTMVGNLAPTIYGEAVFWAYALATLFVCSSVLGLVVGRFSTARLVWMAVLAGLCLNTRSTFGLALYTGLGLLLAVLLVQAVRRSGLRVALGRAEFLAPALVAAALVVVTGGINYGRWGNPLIVQQFQGYLYLRVHPDRLERWQRYGLFTVSRFLYALQYYFAPIWFLNDGAGHTLFEAAEVRLFDLLELPPSSLFLTDLPAFVLGSVLVRRLWTGRADLDRLQTCALLAGLLVPWCLALTLWALTNRYRIEFAPAFDFCTLLGFYAIASEAPRFVRPRLVLVATVVCVLSAQATLLLYQLSDLGDAHARLRNGVIGYYVEKVHFGRAKLGR